MLARPGPVREVLRGKLRTFPRWLQRPAKSTSLNHRGAWMHLDLLGVAASTSERVTLVAEYGSKEILIDAIVPGRFRTWRSLGRH